MCKCLKCCFKHTLSCDPRDTHNALSSWVQTQNQQLLNFKTDVFLRWWWRSNWSKKLWTLDSKTNPSVPLWLPYVWTWAFFSANMMATWWSKIILMQLLVDCKWFIINNNRCCTPQHGSWFESVCFSRPATLQQDQRQPQETQSPRLLRTYAGETTVSFSMSQNYSNLSRKCKIPATSPESLQHLHCSHSSLSVILTCTV